MGILLGFLRQLLGRCPVCGGPLEMIDHDCLLGDTYKCTWCGREWETE